METRPSFTDMQKVLEFVWNSPHSSFYRDKYRKAGIQSIANIRSWEDFRKLPFLEREELVRTDPYKRFFHPTETIQNVNISSGTTGGDVPLITLKKPTQRVSWAESSELDKIKKRNVRALMSLIPNPSSGLSYFLAACIRGDVPFFYATGDINNLETTAKMAKVLRIDALWTTPAVLYFFLPSLAKEYGTDEIPHITYIKLSGDYCSENAYALFKKTFPRAYFSFAYASSEGGGMGYRCDHLAEESLPRFFHPYPRQSYMEVHGNENELILSDIVADAGFPLIRYKTGDSVLLSDHSCKCGNAKLIEVFGKKDFNMLRIQGTTLYAEEVGRALAFVKNYLATSDFQLHAYEETKQNGIFPKLRLMLVPKREALAGEPSLQSILQKEISAHLYLSSKLTLKDLVERNVFLPLEIEFVESFPFSLKKKYIISHIR